MGVERSKYRINELRCSIFRILLSPLILEATALSVVSRSGD